MGKYICTRHGVQYGLFVCINPSPVAVHFIWCDYGFFLSFILITLKIFFQFLLFVAKLHQSTKITFPLTRIKNLIRENIFKTNFFQIFYFPVKRFVLFRNVFGDNSSLLNLPVFISLYILISLKMLVSMGKYPARSAIRLIC